MAQITTTEAADIIPKFWLNEVLQAYYASSTIAQLVRRDFSRETQNIGDTINIPKRGSVSVQTKTENSPVTPEAPTNSKVPVLLNRHKYVSWKIEDHASAKATDQGLAYIRDAIPLLIEEIEGELLGEYVNAGNAIGTAGVPLTEASVRLARHTLNTEKVPSRNRIMIVSSDDEMALLGQSLFVAADKRGDDGTALREASVGRVFGFDVFMSQLVNSTSNPATRHNIAMHPDGLVLAVRPLPLPAPGSGVRAGVVMDDNAGISFRYTQGYSQTDMAMMHTVDILYGIKTTRPECLVEVRA